MIAPELIQIGMPVVHLPLVSVIITNHNYERYVKSAIESIKAQTYPRVECVIIDDCSNDNSFAVISEHLKFLNDDRFRVIRLANNVGQLGAMKAGLENTSGPFVHFFDADDIVFPHFLQKHIEAHLNASYSAGITASDTMQIDHEGQILETTFHSLLKHRSDVPAGLVKPINQDAVRTISDDRLAFKHLPADLLYVDRAFTGWHVVATSAMVFRRDALDLVMTKDTNAVRICADYYLAQYVHFVTGTITIGSTLSGFRLHRENAFSKNAILGGPYPPGHLDPHVQYKLDSEISKHLINNIDRMKDILGIEYCMRLIQRTHHAGILYSMVQHSPVLRLAYGSGSDKRFARKYKSLSVLFNRFPAGYRLLRFAASIGRRVLSRLKRVGR